VRVENALAEVYGVGVGVGVEFQQSREERGPSG
jgi:hypothetical protein